MNKLWGWLALIAFIWIIIWGFSDNKKHGCILSEYDDPDAECGYQRP